MSYVRPVSDDISRARLGTILVWLGVIAAIGAGVWWQLVAGSGRSRFSEPASTTGPLILAVVGGFITLCGVIIYAGSPEPRRYDLPPPSDDEQL